MIWFKRRFETDKSVHTVYGAYEEDEVTDDGDVLCMVYCIEENPSTERLEYDSFEDYIEPDEVEAISKEEYLRVLEELQKVDELNAKKTEILKKLNK